MNEFVIIVGQEDRSPKMVMSVAAESTGPQLRRVRRRRLKCRSG